MMELENKTQYVRFTLGQLGFLQCGLVENVVCSVYWSGVANIMNE